jgi:anti-sigma-K factor RskA
MTTADRHTPELAQLLPAYALGALDGADREALEAHLAEGCPECRRELERWEGDLESLAASLPPVAPSDVARARVLEAIEEPVRWPHPPAPREAEPGRRRWPVWLPVAAALALAVLAGGGYQGARREADQLGAERERLARQVADLDAELAAARTEGRRLARALEVVAAPGMRPVVLAALGGRPGSGRAFVDPASRRAVFVAAGLPALPADRDYELWFIADGKPVPAGVFDVDAAGRARLEVEQVAPPEHIDAWAVTVEPAGGKPQPTGDMVLKG